MPQGLSYEYGTLDKLSDTPSRMGTCSNSMMAMTPP